MTIEIIEGDCREVLKELPDQSVHCIVTSPPYFGLRDYGVENQMGLEPTPAEFVEALVGVMQEARRVLRDDGTLWLNLGDSYAGSGRGKGDNTGVGETAREAAVTKGAGEPRIPRGSTLPAGFHEDARQAGQVGRAWVKPPFGFKQKDLIGIPWRVAFALQADGWYLRQDIIWHKPNPMPESVRDRCTKAHEYIFLLSKSPTYYFDADAMQENAVTNVPSKNWKDREYDQSMLANQQANGVKGRPTGVAGYTAPGKRNRRSVWTVTTKPFKEAHFATFPPDLIEPCVLAGCPEGGTVLDPFFGAGTTGLVCQRTGRDCIGIELNPEYYDIAARRLWPEDYQQAAE